MEGRSPPLEGPGLHFVTRDPGFGIEHKETGMAACLDDRRNYLGSHFSSIVCSIIADSSVSFIPPNKDRNNKMDLLGDIGAADQLTSTRAENKVLREKVKALEQRCKVLTVENETLKAEVELYRQEHGDPSSSANGDPSGNSSSNTDDPAHDRDHFVKSGNGTYTKSREVWLDKLHGISNPSCCSLSSDDTLLATGGADRNLNLLPWGAALGDGDDNAKLIREQTVRVECSAPVIAVDFCRKASSTASRRTPPFCAVGCMDGTVHLVHYQTSGGLRATKIPSSTTIKHAKYVRAVAWSPSDDLLATASADGCVQVHKITWDGLDIESTKVEKIESLNLAGPVESLCFHKNFLVCYARGTPYLSYFDLNEYSFEQTKHNLNQGAGNAGFTDHVSFCVMDMVPHGEYLALATDTSRNIVVEFATGKQIRNLYGHKNDGFSQPKIAWSQNGQYLYGNTQDDSALVVWDIASATIVDRLEGHANNIRDLYSSPYTDTLVTTSFDKQTHMWFAPAE